MGASLLILIWHIVLIFIHDYIHTHLNEENYEDHQQMLVIINQFFFVQFSLTKVQRYKGNITFLYKDFNV